MAKKPNYGFEKRRKEMDKKAKKEEKRLRKIEEAKREAREQQPADEQWTAPQE